MSVQLRGTWSRGTGSTSSHLDCQHSRGQIGRGSELFFSIVLSAPIAYNTVDLHSLVAHDVEILQEVPA
mgnify:CR=1 FL=1